MDKSLSWLMIVAFSVATMHVCDASSGELTNDEILKLPSKKDNNDSGVEIDELMPDGEEDGIEIKPNNIEKIEKKVRADYGRSLDELMPNREDDIMFARSNFFDERAADYHYSSADLAAHARRNAMAIGKKYHWPKAIIPYEFDDEISRNKEQQQQIYMAMKEWESKTCVDFKPYSAAVAAEVGHEQRVRIVADQKGCWSYMGMQPGRKGQPQILSLQRDICMHARLVMHELGHLLGFHHEQSRFDRDDFLDVFMDNVAKNQGHNFKKAGKEFLSDSTPYDFLSIMHYGKESFAKTVNGKRLITMMPKDKYNCYLDLIGKTSRLSHYDAKSMNMIYGCTTGCESLTCGTDCYATKSGEDKSCHCVCLDNSNNPCKGGSCFNGDLWSTCAAMISVDRAMTCTTKKQQCCKSCESYKP